MKKYIHPKLESTLIITKNKTTFNTSWIFYKKKLKLVIDFLHWIKN